MSASRNSSVMPIMPAECTVCRVGAGSGEPASPTKCGKTSSRARRMTSSSLLSHNVDAQIDGKLAHLGQWLVNRAAKIFREFRQCRESESVAICWVWLNYEIDAAALYPMNTVSAQAAILVLIQLALYALIGVPRS
jgi:hypothetical protein